MPAQLEYHAYGKSNIRLVKVIRHADYHDLFDMTVDVALEGDFSATFLTGDNRGVLPTDTTKNTVYALAKRHNFSSIEEFGLLLASHFLDRLAHLDAAKISLRERMWQRIEISNNGNKANDGAVPHPHAFTGTSREQHTAVIYQTRTATNVTAGVTELPILKTIGSGFRDFLRDEFTTLEETDDRLFGTNLTARWRYQSDLTAVDFKADYALIRQTLLETFAQHSNSRSVQQTLFLMGQGALDVCAAIEDIYLAMPNEHRLLVDLAPFHMDNPNEIFLPIDEPSGMIEARLGRKGAVA